MSSNHQNLDFEIYVRLHDLQKILAKYQPDGEFDQEMNRYLELIRTKRYRVAVLGEFSRGKSSLINALLGSSILPADVLPSTATINRVTFGLEPHVEIRYRDGKAEDIAIDALEQYVTKLTEESQETAATIEEAVVVYPTVICQNHIDIIDTPGLNDSEDMTILTRSQLNQIDAAIVTVSALSPLSSTERELILSLIESPEIGYLIFAVSFIDRVDEEDVDRVLADIRSRVSRIADSVAEKHGAESALAQKARRILDNPELYGISAKKALKAFETNSSKMLKASCFPDFQKALYRILTTQQNINAISKSLQMMMGTKTQLEAWYQRRLAAIRENEQRVLQAGRSLEAYLEREGNQANLLVQQKIPAPNRKALRNKLLERYKAACIAELAKVTEDKPDPIRQAALECEKRIREITADFLEEMRTEIAGQLMQTLEELKAQRDRVLCTTIAEADPERSQQLMERMETAMAAARELQGVQPPKAFTFRETDISNIRHCNLIGHLGRQAEAHHYTVLNCVDQVHQNACRIGLQTAQEDTGEKAALNGVYQEFIHNTQTDILLYQRQYVKHQEELEEIYRFCEELERDILA